MGALLELLSGKRVAVIGAGVEGLSSIPFLLTHGAIVELRDRLDQSTLAQKIEHIQSVSKHLTCRGGTGYLDDLGQFDLIIRSPGVPWLTPELVEARDTGVVVTSQTELVMQYSNAPIIGVTGTKGKSTTAALIAHILEQNGKKVWLGGNNGQAAISFIDSAQPQDTVVLELSSFQLQGLSISPHIAVVLDITSEHMDHHRSREEYIRAKQTIVQYQQKSDIAILDADSLSAVHFAASTLATVSWFSNHKMVEPGVYAKKQHDQWYLKEAENGQQFSLGLENELLLPGTHNVSNIAAAACACLSLGLTLEQIGQSVKTFHGLPHRQQNLGIIQNRTWIDDSYSTAPDATIAALEAFGNTKPILVVGGSSKGYGFAGLAQAIVDTQPKAVVYIGQTGPVIADEVRALAKESAKQVPKLVAGGQNIDDIIQQIMTVSDDGDTVVFSPGCASFGLFANVADRAAQFGQAVENLGAQNATA